MEALHLVDHHLPSSMNKATKVEPLILKGPDAPEKWWEPYYKPDDITCDDRMLFTNPME